LGVLLDYVREHVEEIRAETAKFKKWIQKALVEVLEGLEGFGVD